MKIIVIILVSIIFFNTSNARQESLSSCDSTKEWSFMHTYCPCNNEGTADHNNITANQSTFEGAKPVYCLPALSAGIIDTLPPFTRIIVLKDGTDTLSGQGWLKIAWQQVDQTGSGHTATGYITKENTSLGIVSGNTPNGQLDFILGESPEPDTFNFGHKFRLASVFYNGDQYANDSSSIQYLDLDIGAVNYYNRHHLSAVYDHALKNMPNLLRLYWHHGESCPESEGSVFMISNKGKPETLLQASGTGEGGWYDYTRVYIPLKFDNGKILLVENGDREKMFNTWDATLNTIPYPKNCGIPITELLITIEEEAQGKTGANGKYLLNKEGTEIMETLHKVIRYYQWNGTKLRQVKKITIKDGKHSGQ